MEGREERQDNARDMRNTLASQTATLRGLYPDRTIIVVIKPLLSDEQFAAKEKDELCFNAKEKEVLTKDNKINFNSYVVTIDSNTISLI
ncbi:predicted protein [Pyrenophora tritici-repentis Pt-1C-BFP]|uniref:Uncharacterized protein n=1 Tax=Pyrenophora tritici-repentis (strain Pt-1C-BFP) TaxID=426418 RepID=B2VS94_PYRTR|nr:uncharacterized protein PTRG_01720 [Pyrenophora tritici-repentis Pt-1C-BFP]EDU41158.1 predicted protein [Pyrenophora tritici-repentis Pt-1C-BFP]